MVLTAEDAESAEIKGIIEKISISLGVLCGLCGESRSQGGAYVRAYAWWSILFFAVCLCLMGWAVEKTPAFQFEKAEGKYLRLLDGTKPVLTYNYGMILKEGVPEDRRRSCYIHPLYGLDGEILTDDFPADHLHHRGLCWVWPRVIVGEKEYDLWDLRGVEQRFEQWLGEKVTAERAEFGVASGWYVGDEKIVDERVRVRVFRASEKGRAIDVSLTLEAVKDPVTISGSPPVKGYGGFSFRFAPREETVITMPDGREVEDSDLKRYSWADLSAKFGGRSNVSGVAIFDDPRNPGSPNGWTLRHYGFLGVAFPGLKLYTLKPGEPLTLRYRIWVHRGDAKEGEVAAYGDYFRAARRKMKGR